MSTIYEQHDAAFANVSAYVIAKDGERVATIAIKYPRDGAGRLYAYVHWLGLPMVRGHANGYGYDKRSAAICVAARQLAETWRKGTLADDAQAHGLTPFLTELVKDDGHYWDNRLRKAGFDVWQAI